MKRSGQFREFKELEKARVENCYLVQVQIGTRTCPVSFYAIPVHQCPTLIGRTDLCTFDVYADLMTNHLVDRSTLEIIAVATDNVEPKIQPRVQEGIAAVKNEIIGVMEKRRTEFNQKVLHLTTVQQSYLWNAFLASSRCWISPRLGSVTILKVEFKLKGSPFKDRLRPFNARMRELIKENVTKLLVAKAVCPCSLLM